MKTIFVSLLLLFSLTGCAVSSRALRREESLPTKTNLSKEVGNALVKYTSVRKSVTDFFKLPEQASAEEIRPHLARFFKLSNTASWEDILQTPYVRLLCTEHRRKKCVELFMLRPDADWIEIGHRAEFLWTELR